MIKKDLENTIEKDFQKFESGELSPQERVLVVDRIILNSKEYLKKYKMPYKHPFMNDKIKITKNLLDELESMKQELIKTI